MLWDVDTLDWKYRSVASILRYLKAEVRPGSIVLRHDGGGNRSQTVAALPEVIAWLRSQGYALATVDQQVQTLPVKGEVNPGGSPSDLSKRASIRLPVPGSRVRVQEGDGTSGFM